MTGFRWMTGATVLLLAAGLVDAISTARDLGVTTASTQWLVLFAMWGLALLAAVILFVFGWLPAGRGLANRIREKWSRTALPPPPAAALCGLFALVLPVLVLAPLPEPLGRLMETFSWRAVAFWLAALGGAIALSTGFKAHSFESLLAGTALAFAAVHQAAVFIPDISTSPFSLGWSEASRYYYASLFAAERIYGERVPWSVLHPTRYWLQAAPFLVSGLPLWIHRLWQVFLWLGANGLAAWLLARRPGLRSGGGAGRALLAVWAFLFLFQGPIWYHLVVIAALLYWGIDAADFRRTLLVVVAASIWAGASRVNWIPFPAALAALIYFIEVPQDGRSLPRYLAPVLAWGIAGTGAGFAAQSTYMALSGNPPDQFGSAFTSDLLWYRLFPSATYPLGVLPGILLVTLPPAAALWWAVRSGQGRAGQGRALPQHWIAAILAVFLAGGLVVSVKIGGGSNLHNLDGYIALLLAAVVCGVLGSGVRMGDVPRWVVGLAILVPIGFAVSVGVPVQAKDPDALAAELSDLERLVDEAVAGGGAVLFIAERHLLVFGPFEAVALVPDYEKVFLMEMAMAGNTDYLDRFESELENGRFALIVTDPVRYNPQGSAFRFGEENDAWDRYVTYPLLCFYEEVQTLETARVEVLAPKANPECPPVNLIEP